MKSYSSLIHEFSVWQRRELEALFIVLDWAKSYQKKYPNQSIGKEWLNATELTIRIVYDDAFSSIQNRVIAFFSGSDTTEAPPEIIRSVIKDLEKHTCPVYMKSNYSKKSSPISSTYDNGNDVVNIMYFGPAYRTAEKRNSSTQDLPFNFQFPNTMHFNFGDRKQDTSSSTLSFSSSASITEKDQIQETTKQEIPEVFEPSHLDLSRYFCSSLESDNSNPAIEFFRISSGFIPPPKNSDIAKKQCTSPFCLCSSVKAAYENKSNEDNLDDIDDISEVPIEPYLEVENFDFPEFELPDSLDCTPNSYMLMQPFNTPDSKRNLDTSSESIYNENVTGTSFLNVTMPGTPSSNPDDKELMLQPFNTPVTPGNMSGSSNLDTSLSSSLGVADLGLDEDVARVLTRKFTMDNDEEYIQQERLRILSSYEKSRLQMEQESTDENENESIEIHNFATSTPKSHYCGTAENKSCSRDH